MPVACASNRSLRYGDGLFETMRWEHGKILLESFHFERLFHGLRVLQFELPPDFTADYLSAQIRELCKNNNQDKARIRLNVFREESPALIPVNNRPQFIIESTDLPDPNPNPVSTTIYNEEKKFNLFSTYYYNKNDYIPFIYNHFYEEPFIDGAIKFEINEKNYNYLSIKIYQLYFFYK